MFLMLNSSPPAALKFPSAEKAEPKKNVVFCNPEIISFTLQKRVMDSKKVVLDGDQDIIVNESRETTNPSVWPRPQLRSRKDLSLLALAAPSLFCCVDTEW